MPTVLARSLRWLSPVLLPALVAAGCSDTANPRGFDIAASQGDLAEVERFLAEGDVEIDQYSAGVTALQNAAVRGHIDVVETLYAAGADASILTEHGDSTLGRMASGTGSVEIGNWLIAHGADPCVPISPWLSDLRDVETYVELARSVGNRDYAEFLTETTANC